MQIAERIAQTDSYAFSGGTGVHCGTMGSSGLSFFSCDRPQLAEQIT